MKNEFYKILHNKFTYIIYGFLCLIICAAAFLYYFTSSQTERINDLGYGVVSYESQEELSMHILEIENSIKVVEEKYSMHEITKEDFDETMEDLNGVLKISQYLRENKIDYNEVKGVISLQTFENERLSYFRYIMTVSEIVLSVSIMGLCILVFNYEESIGVHKIVYSQTSRIKILSRKFCVYFVCILIMYIFSASVSLLLSIQYSASFSTLLIYSLGSVKAFGYSEYIFKSYLTLLCNGLYWAIIFSAVSIMLKKVIVPSLVECLAFFVVQLGVSQIPSTMALAFTQFAPMIYEVDISITQFVCASVIKLIVLAILLISGIFYFRKKDLA